jgi:uncharacterized protein YabE (DUF348 family)/3D (Asp-Asp-Asp) domain-containing protein
MLTREAFRARLYPKDALLGRLEGAKTSSTVLLTPRRVLHLFLVLLVVSGASLLFLLGPAAKKDRPATAALTIGQTDGLDGAARDGIATDGVARDGESETISIAGMDIEPMSEGAPGAGDDDGIGVAAASIELVGEAVPVVLHEDGLTMDTASAGYTVGDVLVEKGVVVNDGDYLFPPAGNLVTAGTNIYIYHARELFLSQGGETTTIHSRKATVADVLDEATVSLGPFDRVDPPLDAPVQEGMTVCVVRVEEDVETVEETIPLTVVYQDDPTMDMGQYVVLDWGADGVIHREYRVRYEDGQETERELLTEWEQPPSDQIIAQGTRPVNLVQTPQGPLRYSYSFDVYATWYRPASCGRSPDSPWYGIAATGVPVRRGIVAVDPSVIPLGTHLYVPGYGQAIAADTGSAVVGNIIDLGFADYETPDWRSGWVTVYILQ